MHSVLIKGGVLVSGCYVCAYKDTKSESSYYFEHCN